MVQLRVFRVGTYSTGVFLMTMLGFVLYGSMLLVHIFLQTLLAYSSMDAGIAMTPRGSYRSTCCGLGFVCVREEIRHVNGVAVEKNMAEDVGLLAATQL